MNTYNIALLGIKTIMVDCWWFKEKVNLQFRLAIEDTNSSIRIKISDNYPINCRIIDREIMHTDFAHTGWAKVDFIHTGCAKVSFSKVDFSKVHLLYF